MGFIKKLINGKARHYKVYRRCSECEDTSVKVVTTKSGRDLKALAKENPTKLMDEIYGKSCSKCSLSVEDMVTEEVRKSKKVYEGKEIE